MSRLNAIQAKLGALNGDSFQKLCDSYLYKKGFEQLNPIGSVPGVDKARPGTPDSYIPLPNGKYVFCEYTSQKTRLFEKLRSDLGKCFSETNTGIPVDRIEAVVLCHTSTLTLRAEHALRRECQMHGVTLHMFGIGPMSHDLCHKYPGIAADHLGIQVDTMQIVTPDEFVSYYNRSKLATPLDTDFRFREAEVEEILAQLRQSDVVVITGRPGVGKSRAALESVRRFVGHNPEYQPWCIFNRGLDLTEDIRVHFSDAGQYLVFIDDANRTNGLDYIVQTFIANPDCSARIIITVRDYAVDVLRETLRPYGGAKEVKLKHMTDDQIKQIVEGEYGVKHPDYLKRICDVAAGNPRLAIMAAQIAVREKDLNSISDVSALYDDYFASIRHDIQVIGDHELLQVAGVVAFLQHVDRANMSIMDTIQIEFGLSASRFWARVRQLHDLEIVDLYENEVVRISDQVLATYLMYRALFKERVLRFDLLLGPGLFPRMSQRLVDALNPVFSAFNFDELKQAMRPHVDAAWESLLERGPQSTLMHLIKLFWFVKESDSLLYLKRLITALVPTVASEVPEAMKKDSNVSSLSILDILSVFRSAKLETMRMAIQLMFNYLEKQPTDLLKVLYILEDRFGFTHISYHSGYVVQKEVIQSLWRRTKGGDDLLFSKLYIALTQAYLKTRYHTTEAKGHRAITVIDFELPHIPELQELRELMWGGLFHLHANDAYRRDVEQVLQYLSTARLDMPTDQTVAWDANLVLPFIRKKLRPTEFRCCRFVHAYLDLLERAHVPYDADLRVLFTTATYQLSRLLVADWAELREVDFDRIELARRREERLTREFSHYSLADFQRMFTQSIEIKQELDGPDNYQFDVGISDILILLSGWNPELFVKVIRYYLGMGDPLRVQPWGIVNHLLKVCGVDQATAVVLGATHERKDRWRLSLYSSLSAGEIETSHIDQLYDLYRTGSREDLRYPLDYLLQFEAIGPGIVAEVTAIVLSRAQGDAGLGPVLDFLFNPYCEISKVLLNLFAGRLDLLQQAYMVAVSLDPTVDHDGTTLSRIMEHDRSFLFTLLGRSPEHPNAVRARMGSRTLAFVWLLDDYDSVARQILDTLFERQRDIWHGEWLDSFFVTKPNEAPEARRRQDVLFKELISQRHQDVEFMRFLFGIGTRFASQRRYAMMAEFVRHNQTFEDFVRLPLEPVSWGWSGSEVPILCRRIASLQGLLPYLDGVDLLEQHHHVERSLEDLQGRLAAAKKSDFIDGDVGAMGQLDTDIDVSMD